MVTDISLFASSVDNHGATGAHDLVDVFKRPFWLLHGEGAIGGERWRQGDQKEILQLSKQKRKRWEEDVGSGMEVKPRELADGLGVGTRRERSQRDPWAGSHLGDGAIL